MGLAAIETPDQLVTKIPASAESEVCGFLATGTKHPEPGTPKPLTMNQLLSACQELAQWLTAAQASMAAQGPRCPEAYWLLVGHMGICICT